MSLTPGSFLQVLLWSAPWVLIALAMILVAMLRRDSGRWWKLLAAAGAVLLVATVWDLGKTIAFTSRWFGSWDSLPTLLFQVTALISLALHLLAVGLATAAAVLDRAPAGRPGPPPPSAPHHLGNAPTYRPRG